MTTMHRRALVGALVLLAATTTTTGAVSSAAAGRSAAQTAADPWLDQSFGGGLTTIDLSPGRDVPAGAVVLQDGRVVVAATKDYGTYHSDIVVRCFLPDGRPDTDFGTGGQVVLDYSPVEVAIGVAVQPDGMIVVGGGGNTPMILARLDGAGRLDPTFSGGVVRVDLVSLGFYSVVTEDMALAPDGKIVVSGEPYKDDAAGVMAIRFNGDGTLDQGFGDNGTTYRMLPGSRAYGTSIAVQPDGGVVVAGTESNGVYSTSIVENRFTLTRFSPTGALDTAFGDGGATHDDLSRGSDRRNAYVKDIAVQPDGKIVAAGSIVHINAGPQFRMSETAVVRYLPDGRLDPGFGAAGVVVSLAPPTTIGAATHSGGSQAEEVRVDRSGRILVVGLAAGLTRNLAFARYTPTGILDQSFGRAGWVKIDAYEVSSVNALAIQPDGRSVFAGTSKDDATLVLGRLPAFAGSTAVTAWGYNGQGQLGDDSTAPHNVPVPVLGPGAVGMPSAGLLQSLSLRGDGKVFAWGWNALGQLGDGTATTRDTPVQVPGLENVSAIAAGGYHALAVSGGRVYAWGWNGVGQLGDGTIDTRYTPVLVPGLTDVVEVAAGLYHSMARLSDGSVWAWGWNGLGQLGDGTAVDRHRPVRVPGLFQVSHISAGALHSLAVASLSETVGARIMWGWGWNALHQVDASSAGMMVSPSGGFGREPVAISAGGYHSLALFDDGTIYAWGSNFVGQLGKGTTIESPYANAVIGLTDATSISAGLLHTLATDERGQVWGWGWNVVGQLGDGTTTNRSSPTPAIGATGASDPSAGWYHSLTSNSPPR